MKSILLAIVVLLCMPGCCNESIILRSKPHGMFSMFHYVLFFLQQYDRNKIDGFRIDFAKTGLYYAPERGQNWWEYYFEPVDLGEKSNHVFCVEEDTYIDLWAIEFINSTKENYNLIKKYIRVKECILEKVAKFQKIHLQNEFIIGVHYRGTDKLWYEAPKVEYDKVISVINEEIAKLPPKRKYKIFLATDEQQFLEYAVVHFGNRLCYCDMKRSSNGTPIHLDEARDPYLAGEEALVDALILSRTNLLIRTSSNLSLCSLYFNPTIPVVELSQRTMTNPCLDYFH